MSAVTKFSDVQLRKDWGARRRNGFGARSIPVTLWLHHTVTTHLPRSATVAQERAQMRVLEDIGQQRFGGGVSYNWILFPSGRLYQGIGVRRRGAHTLGHNVTGMAVALAGNFQNTPMTENQLRTLAWFLPFAQSQGWIRQARFNGGHRDAPGNSTACPGDAAHRQITEVHRRVDSGSTPASSTPSPSTPSSSEGNTMATPRQIWSYGNDSIQKGRQVFNMLRHATDDSEDVQKRIRRNDWRRWLAFGIGERRFAPNVSLTSRWDIREDGYKLITWIQYAYLQARMARNNASVAISETRQVKEMIKALAQAQDEGHGKILNAVNAAETRSAGISTMSLAIEDDLEDPDTEDDDEDTSDDDTIVEIGDED